MSRSLLPMDDAGIDDLVRKLETGGYVPQLLRTVDGSQLVTRRRLRTDVEKSLDEAGGLAVGLSLIRNFWNALGVDLSHIEEATQDLINDSGGSIVIVQGHVISRCKYLDQMTIEINSLMAKMGQLTIMDLCEKYALPADWLQPQVESKLGDTIHAHADTTDRGVYYTKEFFERGKTTVCAAMNEKTSPTSLEELQKEFPHIHQRIFYSIVESLMKEHRVLGKLKGRKDNAVYPQMFVTTTKSDTQSAEFDTIAEADIRDPQSFAKERYPSSVILSGCIIHESLLAEIECAVEDAISADSCVDIADVLPISVSDSDYSIILNHISSMEASAESPDTVTRVLESRFVTSQRFIDGCLAKLDPAIRARVNAVHARTHAERERIHAEKEGGEGGKGKGKASGRFFRKDSPHQGEDIGPEEVAEVIQREHPEMPAVVAYAMGRHLAPFATSILQSMLASVFLPAASPSNVSSPNESGRLAASERSMSQLAELWTLILLCKRGIDLFEELVPLSETDAAATSREYVRTIVGQLPDTLQTFLSEVEAALDGKPKTIR
ncbi:hypothetical protein HK104_009833 [Borealophlyctis nickersoniae]|nr:hypothetical protein HK104_009833 [Borealophlyctis nickersoniae]